MTLGRYFLVVIFLVSVLVSGCKVEPTETTSTTIGTDISTTDTETPAPSVPATQKPADFIVSNLTINPDEVKSGDSILIEVLVTNSGESSGTYKVNLKIDGNIVATENVTLVGGTNQKVKFTRSESAAKTYSVGVNDLSGTFTVKALTISPTPSTTPEPETTATSTDAHWTEWGLAKFGKDYPATYGTKITYVKAGESTSKDGYPAIRFEFLASNLPQDRIYYLWYLGLGDETPQKFPYEMKIGDGGYVMAGSSRLSLSLHSFAKGEAQTVALMTLDKSIIAYGKIILYPIEAKIGNCRIWVELASPKGDMFIIYGEGFEAHEEIETTSASNGELIKSKTEVDNEGKFMTILLPAIVGQQSGTVTYTVIGKMGTLAVSFEWGTPALSSGP